MNKKFEINKVSIIIPVYNRSMVIGKTIESVINQKCDYKLEVVIVDDFSEDRNDLIKVVEKYQQTTCSNECEIKLVLHSENRHGGAARNTGVENSTGDVIAFLDSDDVWLPEKIDMSVQHLIESDSDFCYHKLTYNNDAIELPSRSVNDDESFMDYLICHGGSMQTSTLVFKRKVFDEIGFSEDLKKYQDFDLILKCEIKSYKVGFIPEVLTIMDNTPGVVRISNSFNPVPSIYWFEKVKNNLSIKAKNEFVIKRVVKYFCLSNEKGKAIKFLLSNIEMPLRIKTASIAFAYLITPLIVINGLKKVKHRLKK